MVYGKQEPIENLVTWVYEGSSFVPSAKLINDEKFSIINDYIGRPIQAYNEKGDVVWETDYDIYGGLREFKGDRDFIPFRQLGQYEDVETGLYYNRFRYYNPETGLYLSQDPIGIEGSNPNFYAYVFNSNFEIDLFGLDCQIHHLIPQAVYKQFRKDFKKVKGYVQAVSHRVAKNRDNLIPLDTPFHGNHPKYNEYVSGRVQDLINNNELDIKNVNALQNELRDLIGHAEKSGKTLNEFFTSLTL